MRKLKEYKNIDLGLFLIRLGVALVFIVHGYLKLSNMSGPQGTIEFFTAVVGAGAFWAYVVALIELLGGLAILFGIWTYWAGVLLAVVMVFAITLVKIDKGFAGGYEFDLMLLLTALAISTIGPGEYTVKKVIGK